MERDKYQSSILRETIDRHVFYIDGLRLGGNKYEAQTLRSSYNFLGSNSYQNSSIQQELDEIAKRSAKVLFKSILILQDQGLSIPITSYHKLVGEEQKIFIFLKKNEIRGYLKVGMKNLFYCDKSGKQTRVELLCVLDFFVESNQRRRGIGKVKIKN